MRRPSWIFTSRDWRAEDGDPSQPEEVLGLAVTERLGARRDAPGALVRLADRRYALTGRTLAVGLRRQLDRYIQKRARHIQRRAPDASSANWYAEARLLLKDDADSTPQPGDPGR